MATPITNTEWIEWMARLMESSAGVERLPQRDSSGYCCLLDEQPTHLVPERLLQRLRATEQAAELSFNLGCHLDGGVPENLRAAELSLADAFRTDLPAVWVQDPATELWSPFALSEGLRELVASIRTHPEEVAGLPESIKTLLQRAEILVPSNHASQRCGRWNETASRCCGEFREKGYAVVDGLVHPFQLAEMRRYFRRQIRTGKVRLGDGQSPLRYIAHNDPVARFFHVQLTKAVSDLVGEGVKPSYVYMASYVGGAQLERHTDREQCEFSVSFCLDYAPEPSGATPWPLYLDTPRGTTTIHQAIGDGLLYRGRRLPHYRKTLAQGNTSTSLFLHYVAEDFDGALE
jgi:hypothetical protein